MKQENNIKELVIEGTRGGPEKLSAIAASESDYSDKLYVALKSKTPQQVIESCDEEGKFFIRGQIGKVTEVYLDNKSMDFSDYVKKYDSQIRLSVPLPTTPPAYYFT